MDGEEERFKTPVHLTPRLIWNDAPQVRPQTREVYLMNEKLERDRGRIESAIVDAYDFWIRTGMPTASPTTQLSMSAFRPITSASPSAADAPGTVCDFRR